MRPLIPLLLLLACDGRLETADTDTPVDDAPIRSCRALIEAELPAALSALRDARASLSGADPATSTARRELALFEAELCAGSAFLLLPARGEETRQRCRRAQAAALVALADPALGERLSGAEESDLGVALQQVDAAARLKREALFWWAFARGAEGLTLRYGWFDSPFGPALAMGGDRGLCGLAFAAEVGPDAALADLRALAADMEEALEISY